MKETFPRDPSHFYDPAKAVSFHWDFGFSWDSVRGDARVRDFFQRKGAKETWKSGVGGRGEGIREGERLFSTQRRKGTKGAKKNGGENGRESDFW
jgi:hypothetical protein